MATLYNNVNSMCGQPLQKMYELRIEARQQVNAKEHMDSSDGYLEFPQPGFIKVEGMTDNYITIARIKQCDAWQGL